MNAWTTKGWPKSPLTVIVAWSHCLTKERSRQKMRSYCGTRSGTFTSTWKICQQRNRIGRLWCGTWGRPGTWCQRVMKVSRAMEEAGNSKRNKEKNRLVLFFLFTRIPIWYDYSKARDEVWPPPCAIRGLCFYSPGLGPVFEVPKKPGETKIRTGCPCSIFY